MSFQLPKDEDDANRKDGDGASFGIVGVDNELSNYNTT